MAKGLSRRGYARHRGVSEAAVRQAIKGGRITLKQDGTIDPRAADRQWERNTDPTKPRNSVTGDPKRRKESPDAPSMPMGGNGKGPAESTAGYAKARGFREVYAARLAKLAYEERIGSMVPRAVVERGAYLAGQELRDRILLFSAKLAPVVARLSEERACRELIQKEARALIEDLRKSLERIARPEEPVSRHR